MGFSADRLLAVLQRLPPARAWRVAFSGGCDSTVLLHALAQLRAGLSVPLSALHVDHGLHPDSAVWSQRCEAFCDSLAIPCTTLKVDARPQPGESREAAARRARYEALAAHLDEGEALITAHHTDDQAETFLLQLLRGAGPRGLAAMAEAAPFARGLLLRPLLGFQREELCAYGHAHALSWVEDPSNADVSFDRNFLRHRLMPLLAERWPAADQVIARAAQWQAEAAELQDALAELDGAQVWEGPTVLRITGLAALSPARQRNLLRLALRRCGLPLPSRVVLERVLTEVVPAREDAEPRVAWPGAEVRRYRGRLYLLPPLAVAPDANTRMEWDGMGTLRLPQGLGALHGRAVTGQGLKIQGSLQVGFRAGGEQCQPAGRGHRHSLKHLLQEAGIPPWERERLPLIFVDGQVAAVAGLWVCEPFRAAPGERGLVLQWERFAIETEGENKDNLPGLAPPVPPLTLKNG